MNARARLSQPLSVCDERFHTCYDPRRYPFFVRVIAVQKTVVTVATHDPLAIVQEVQKVFFDSQDHDGRSLLPAKQSIPRPARETLANKSRENIAVV